MADDTTTTTDPQSHMIPQSRYDEEATRRKQERQKREEAEALAIQLQEKISELEDRDKTDVERLTKEREKLEKRVAEAEKRAADLEAKSARDAKASLVERAAAKMNFHDAGDASRHIANLDDIEDAAAAERAVKALAKERSYLVRSDSPETAKLRKIGVDGQVIDDAKDQGLITQEEADRRHGQEMLNVLIGPNTGGGTFPSGQ